MSIVYGDVCRLIVYYATKPFIRIIVIGNIITTKNKCNPNYPKKNPKFKSRRVGVQGVQMYQLTPIIVTVGVQGVQMYQLTPIIVTVGVQGVKSLIYLKEFKKKMGDKCSRVNHL